MIYKLDTLQDTDIISLGNQSENDAQTLEFDISAWLEKWPGGAVQIIYRRPDSPRIYPVLASKITIDSGILRWLVDRSVTAVSGHGYAVISYVQGAVERRTARVNTLVRVGLPPAGPAPDAVADWIAEANTALNAIETLEFTINDNGELLAGETVLGRVSDNPRGNYNPDADPLYSKRDVVFHNGGSYRYINDTPSNEPTSSMTHWQQIAEKGDPGEVSQAQMESAIAAAMDPIAVNATISGADPTGIGDSGAAINTAIQYAESKGIRSVFIPAGTYIIETPVAPVSNMRLFGAGKQTVLKIKPDTDINCIQPSAPVFFTIIEDMTIDGNKANNTFSSGGSAIKIWMDSSIIRRVYTQNISKHSLELNWDGTISDAMGYLNRVEYNEFRDAEQEGVLWGWRTTDSWFCYNNVGSVGANIKLEGGTGRFIGNHFNGNPEYNIYSRDGVNTMMFSHNIIENAKKHAIYMPKPSYRNAAQHISIVDNLIRSCGTDATNTYDFVHIEGYDADTLATGILISSNRLINTHAVKPRYPVYLNYASGTIVKDNLCSDYSGANSVFVENTSNSIVADNTTY